MWQTLNRTRHFLRALLKDLETFPDRIAGDKAITRMLDTMRVLLKLTKRSACFVAGVPDMISNPLLQQLSVLNKCG